jgi:hypothetical protein
MSTNTQTDKNHKATQTDNTGPIITIMPNRISKGFSHTDSLVDPIRLSFTRMHKHFDNGNAEEAQAAARELLLEKSLPVLYRAYAHIVSDKTCHHHSSARQLMTSQILSYGTNNRLFHACKAIEEAQWGLAHKRDGDGMGLKLLNLANDALADARADAAADAAAGASVDNGHGEMDASDSKKVQAQIKAAKKAAASKYNFSNPE